LNRTRRVSQSNESDSFMGSDFSYSDITGVDINDWDYEIVKETDEVDGHDCWVIDSTPKAENRKRLLAETGYEKRRIWVRKDNYYVVRGQYFLAKGKKMKLMQARDLHQIDGIWTAKSISMVTVKKKNILHKSLIEFSDVIYNSEVPDTLFSTSALTAEPSL